jgi:hypothetical protein
MLINFGWKLKLKQGDIKTRVRGNLTATVWQDKQDVQILINMHCPPAEGNFCIEHGKAIKLPAVHGHNRYWGIWIDVTT